MSASERNNYRSIKRQSGTRTRVEYIYEPVSETMCVSLRITKERGDKNGDLIGRVMSYEAIVRFG